MSGFSLGMRSGSFGSLQLNQQQPQGGGVALLIPSPPVASSRKAAKTGTREKDRRPLPWICCKLVGRRKVGMLLLLLASGAVLLSFVSVVNKDEVSGGPEANMIFPEHVVNAVNSDASSSGTFQTHRTSFEGPKRVNNVTTSRMVYSTSPIKTGPASRLPQLPMVPKLHPCENFSFPPPPPAINKRTGPRPCPVCYVPMEQIMDFAPEYPSVSPILKNLSYVFQEKFSYNESNGGSKFGGQPSLQQRSESFEIKESMHVHCGFVNGSKPGHGTGFDIDDSDLHEMEQCRETVVASAIFGNYDIMQQPKNISPFAKANVCFYMFVDEETEAYIKKSSSLDDNRRLGLWRVVVVRNLPYVDARRNGKIPKLLLHRIFPYARFSIWIDGKLELVADPFKILERFLWRPNASFAISTHYRRFDVFSEAEANKVAGKYDNASIDQQIEFYKSEGLTRYTRAKLPIPSDVPEGCVIIREHIPITNLFTCLWFNEVERFTSRDQLSFSTVRDKIMSKTSWSINMFRDCERRNFVVQEYHKDLLELRSSLAAKAARSPPISVSKVLPGKAEARGAHVVPAKARKPPPPPRHGSGKKVGSKRRRTRLRPQDEREETNAIQVL